MKKVIMSLTCSLALIFGFVGCATTSVTGSGIKGKAATVKKNYVKIIDYQGSSFGSEIPQWVVEIGNGNYSSEYLKTIMQRNYEAKVAWEQVLKCYLWIDSKTKPDLIFTNDEMVAAMNISSSTISKAKSPLKNEYEAVKIKKITDKICDNNYRTIGQTAEVSAWWNT